VRNRFGPLLGVIAVLALIVAAAGLGGHIQATEHTGEPIILQPPPMPAPIEDGPPVLAEPDPEEDQGEEGSAFPWGYILTVLAALALAMLVAASIVSMAKRKRREKAFKMKIDAEFEDADFVPGLRVDLPALADAVKEALSRLDEYRVPRDAVVAAWVELEKAAAQHGWFRDLSETTTDFTARLFVMSEVPQSQTTELRGLYQQARFSAAPVTVSQVTQARSALEVIARELQLGQIPAKQVDHD